TETGFTDSDWTVSGQITVTNPNTWEDFTGVNIADLIDNGGDCQITGGTDLTVPRSGSVSVPYTCTFASAPESNGGVNSATASWDANAFFTDNAAASGTASYSFDQPTNVTDQTI